MYFYDILFFCTYTRKFWGSPFSSFRGLRVFVLEVFFSFTGTLSLKAVF